MGVDSGLPDFRGDNGNLWKYKKVFLLNIINFLIKRFLDKLLTIQK